MNLSPGHAVHMSLLNWPNHLLPVFGQMDLRPEVNPPMGCYITTLLYLFLWSSKETTVGSIMGALGLNLYKFLFLECWQHFIRISWRGCLSLKGIPLWYMGLSCRWEKISNTGFSAARPMESSSTFVREIPKISYSIHFEQTRYILSLHLVIW